MRYLLLVLGLLFLGAPAWADQLTYLGDCADGCAPGETMDAANENRTRTEINDNDAELSLLQAPGDGIANVAGALEVDVNATLDGEGLATSLSGMEFTATGELALLQGCADEEILKWEDTGGTWDCADDTGALGLNGLSNVTLTSPAIGSILVNTAGGYIDAPLDLSLTAAVTGTLLDANVDGAAEREEVCGTTSLSSTCEINSAVVGRTEIDETSLSVFTHATDCTVDACSAGEDGELCFDQGADEIWVCDGSGTPTWVLISGGGGGATTDGGAVTRVTGVTDDFAIGGTDSTSTFFFDEGTGVFNINFAGGSIDIDAHATGGSALTLKEGVADGTDTWSLVVPDAGLSAPKVCEVSAAGIIPASCLPAIWLPLAGGELTAEVTVDNLGLEFVESDTLTDCSTFSITGGGIFYDDSDNEFKKCENNSLTTLDTGGGGGEINTHQSDGGGLAITAATPKVVADLRLVSLSAAEFDVDADVVTLDTLDATSAGLTLLRDVEIDIGAGAWTVHATSPPTANTIGTTFVRDVLGFEDGAPDRISIELEIPQTYDNTVAPTIEVIWSSPVQTTLEVCWCIQVMPIADGGNNTPTPPVADCTSDTVDLTATDRNQTLITFGAGSDFVAGDGAVISLFRDTEEAEAGCGAGDDDMAGTANFHTALLQYQVSE